MNQITCGICGQFQCVCQLKQRKLQQQNIMQQMQHRPNPLCTCGTPLKEVSKGKWECQRECWNIKPKVKRWLWRNSTNAVLCASEEELQRPPELWTKIPGTEVEMEE